MDVGAPELLIILVIVLVLFGGAKLPALARSLGQAKKEYQSGMKDGEGNEPARRDDSGESGAKPNTTA